MLTHLRKSAKNAGGPPQLGHNLTLLRGPTGALIIGDAEKVAEKILYVNEVSEVFLESPFR